MLADTFEYNFGVRPTFYVMTNFEEFKSIINSLGGITVEAGAFLSDSCDLPQSRAGRCTVYPGKVNMDGAMALWYVRSRHTSSDFDRGRRAQEVTYALFNRMVQGDIVARAPEIYKSYQSSVDTNLSLNEIMPLLPVALKVSSDSSLVHRYTIGPAYVYNYVTSEGAMVLLPNYNAIIQLLSEAVFKQ
jgi:anionic cell wall polymer biosynthesis LytR-Cps2A-Psr (LCP) family protein